MIQVRKANERGHANHGWLDSNHTFSFGRYQDPDHMGFRVLRVINEDKVHPGNGFGTHPHNDMEIISYVVSGKLEHKDSMGNGSVINAGEFQCISAGSGITHSEFNPSATELAHFYQIWIEPDERGVEPNYAQRDFSSASGLQLVASKGGKDGSLPINQDAKLYLARVDASERIALPLQKSRYGWLQVVKGSISIGDTQLVSSDGIALSNEREPEVVADSDSEFFFFDLP